jgi:hypothetical protein
VDEGGFYGTIYSAGGAYMFLERTGDGENEARWFKDNESLDEYISGRIEAVEAGAAADGGN